MSTGPGSLLVDAAHDAADAEVVANAIAHTVRAWLGAGPVFLASADPATGSFAASYTFDIPEDAAAKFYEIETAGSDVASFSAIAQDEAGVAALYSATDGHPERSERWRDVISELRWGDELRAVVRSRGYTWGYLCLHREAEDRAFTLRDYVRLRALLPAIAVALQRALTVSPAGDAASETGVLIVDAEGHVVSVTEGAAAWLGEIDGGGQGRPPLLIDGVVRQVLSHGHTATTTITTRTNRTAFVEAAPLRTNGAEQIAVVIRSAPPEHALQRYAAAVNLTGRERQIVECVMRGLSTRDMAVELGISPATVQAHLSAVFGKTGFSSRRELASRLRA